MRVSRSRLRAVAPLFVAGTLALAATTANGLELSPVSSIPESAFGPVVLGPDTVARLEAIPTPNLRPLAEPLVPSPPPDRPNPALPAAGPIVRQVVPKTTHAISGLASWYCNFDDPAVPHSICHNAYPDGPGFDAYAAAGPGLRAAIGSGWRNTVVFVCGRKCVQVRLVDWCKCTGGTVGREKLIDLYNDVYAVTGSKVTIRW